MLPERSYVILSDQRIGRKHRYVFRLTMRYKNAVKRIAMEQDPGENYSTHADGDPIPVAAAITEKQQFVRLQTGAGERQQLSPSPCTLVLLKWSHSLHVEAVTYLWMFVQAEIFHYLTNAPGALNRDKILAVELGIVPVHFGQVQNFGANHAWRRVRSHNTNLKRIPPQNSGVKFVRL